MHLISIIVPVYNVEKYIDRCIFSLIEQSYTDLEILLIDDGSTDKSGYICDQWASKDNRIKVVHSSNRGVSHARNLGLSIASGEYISFMDADDWIDLDMYESMMRYIEQFHSDIHVGGFIVDYPGRTALTLKRGMPHSMTPQEAMLEMLSLEKKVLFRGHLCDKLFKFDVLKDIRLDERLKLSEDTWFFWQALQNAKLVSYAPQFSYHYYMRRESATHKKLKKEDGTYLDAIIRIRNDAKNFDETISHSANLFYIAQTVFVLKNILLDRAIDLDDVFSKGQGEIRRNFFNCFYEKTFSRNARIGLCFLSLPKSIILFLAPILRLVKRN